MLPFLQPQGSWLGARVSSASWMGRGRWGRWRSRLSAPPHPVQLLSGKEHLINSNNPLLIFFWELQLLFFHLKGEDGMENWC